MDENYTNATAVAEVLRSGAVWEGNHTTRIRSLCHALQKTRRERDAACVEVERLRDLLSDAGVSDWVSGRRPSCCDTNLAHGMTDCAVCGTRLV